MDTYTLLRQIADSWVLLAMFAFFIGCILWVFRPGVRAQHVQASEMIFKEDRSACANACATCACKTSLDVPNDNA